MVPFLAAVLIFVAASVASALAVLLAGGGRGLSPQIAAASLSVGVLAGVAAFLHTRQLPANDRRRAAGYGTGPVSPWGWLVFVAFALFALRSFCWLVYEDGAHDGHPAQVEIGNVNNLGDISLHMLYARDFANGARWWPEHPQAAGYAMRYYPGMDLFQALLLSLGTNDFNALAWVGLVGSLLALLALYRWGGSFTVAGFLFAGGLAGFQYLKTGELIDFQAEMAWKSLPLAIFITQRPFLFALPAGLLLLAHWREKFFPAEPPDAAGSVPKSRPGLLPFWVEYLLYAIMPAFHVFAFVFLSVLLGWWFMGRLLARSWQRWVWLALAVAEVVVTDPHMPWAWHGRAGTMFLVPLPLAQVLALALLLGLVGWWSVQFLLRAAGDRWHLPALVGAAFLPATGLIYLMTDHFHAGSNIKLQPGWMQHDEPFWKFWLMNFGLFALAAPALWSLCAWWTAGSLRLSLAGDRGANRRRTVPVEREMKTAAAFVLPSGVMFLAACVWLFAPWEWDNTKVMIWCYLAALPFVWERFVRPLPVAVRVAVCTLLFFSGAVTLAGGLGKPDPRLSLLETAELDAVRFTVRDLPAEARFAAMPDYNHPLVYCGRKLAMGYAGHLHSQGIDYAPLASDLDTLMEGRPGWQEAAARLQVRYVFWGPREERHYTNSTLPWADPDEPVAKGDYGTVYEIKPASTAGR